MSSRRPDKSQPGSPSTGAESASSEVMTLGEVAGYLKIAERTLLRMVHNGEIPCAKVGGQWRFLRPVIDDWLLSRMSFTPQSGGRDLSATHRLSRFAHEEHISLGLPAQLSKRDVLTRLAEPLGASGVVTDVERFVRHLLERESMVSTAVAHRVALPHMRRPDPRLTTGTAVSIGVSSEGIDFDSLDGEPTRLFVLLAAESEEAHLTLLAQAGTVLRDTRTVDNIVAARDASEVMRYLIEADYRLLLSTR